MLKLESGEKEGQSIYTSLFTTAHRPIMAETEKLLSSYNEYYGTESGVASEDGYSTYPLSDLISSQEHFTKEEINRQVSKAKQLSVFTLLVTSTIGILSFIASKDSDSTAAYSFAFDSFLAGLASFIILWRFWSTKKLEQRDRRRELIALIIITVSLVVTGTLIAYRATRALVRTEKHKKSTTLLVLCSISVVVYLVLFALKYRLAKRLGSRALRTDSMDALCGAILALSIVITSTTRHFTTDAWFLDSTIALGVAVFSLVYGAYSTVQFIKLYKEYRAESTKEKYIPDIIYQPHA